MNKKNKITNQRIPYTNEYEKILLLILLPQFKKDLLKSEKYIYNEWISLNQGLNNSVNKSPYNFLLKKYKIINENLFFMFMVKYIESNKEIIPDFQQIKKDINERLPIKIEIHPSGEGLTCHIPFEANQDDFKKLKRILKNIRERIGARNLIRDKNDLLRDIELYLFKEKNKSLKYEEYYSDPIGKKIYKKFGSNLAMSKSLNRTKNSIVGLKNHLSRNSENNNAIRWLIADFSSKIYS